MKSISHEQKTRIAAEITGTLERIAHKPKSYTFIALDELPEENREVAGSGIDLRVRIYCRMGH